MIDRVTLRDFVIEKDNILDISTFKYSPVVILNSLRRILSSFMCPKDGNKLDYLLTVLSDVYVEQVILNEVILIEQIDFNFCGGCFFFNSINNLENLKKSFYVLFSLYLH